MKLLRRQVAPWAFYGVGFLLAITLLFVWTKGSPSPPGEAINAPHKPDYSADPIPLRDEDSFAEFLKRVSSASDHGNDKGLADLIRRHRQDRETYLGMKGYWSSSGTLFYPCAYARCEKQGREYVLLELRKWVADYPGYDASRCLLMDPVGRVLDVATVVWNTNFKESIGLALGNQLTADGTVVRILRETVNKGESFISPYLELHEEALTIPLTRTQGPLLGELRILNGRFAITN